MKRPAHSPAAPPRTRVAVYTRQSVASDLEFGSIDAQREAVEAYVHSQRGEGWVALPTRYDDHGFSGGNIDRPAFQRLVADVQAGKVDCIAAYKIDRVSRSLTDFTGFMAMLEKHGVGFVSTTQSFDTRTSMGRLTLNILASFSQFEREVISERTKDKIAATRRKGMWTGGAVPLGYRIQNKTLVVDSVTADAARQAFAIYLTEGSLGAAVAELDRRAIRTRGLRGKTVPFGKNTLRTLLGNPLYRGMVRAGDQLVAGKHEALVDAATWDEVQRMLADHQRPARARPGKWDALLTGVLRCAKCGAAMTMACHKRDERVHRYYVCQTAMQRGAAACRGSRAPAAEIEAVVLARVQAIASDPAVLVATLRGTEKQKDERRPVLDAEAARLANERTQLLGARRHLLDAIQGGTTAATAVEERLAELDEQLTTVKKREAEVAAEIDTLAEGTIDEAQMRRVMADFHAVWNHLQPRERHRVLRLLLARVRFDGGAGELHLDFRSNGLRALERELNGRQSA